MTASSAAQLAAKCTAPEGMAHTLPRSWFCIAALWMAPDVPTGWQIMPGILQARQVTAVARQAIRQCAGSARHLASK